MSATARELEETFRAYSTVQFETKSVDTDQRILEGVASTPELDRVGDSMDPAGAKFALPMPFLWQHRSDQPIGHVLAAHVTDAGIAVRVQIAKGIDFIDDAWRLIKAGLVGGLSIDWRPLAPPERLPGGGVRFKSWAWLALSAVTIPANQSASIRLIKSLDRAVASDVPARAHRPGAAGMPRAHTTMNVSDLLTQEKTTLHTKSARLEELLSEEQAHGTLETDLATERDGLLVDVEKHTTNVKRYQTLEDAQRAQATPLFRPAAPASDRPAAPHLKLVELPKGTRAVRWLLSIAAGKGSRSDTIEYAKRFTDTPEVLALIKATMGTANPGPGSPPSGWGSELVNPNSAATEFVELLRPATILGRVEGFYMVPFNIPIITQTGASTFAWVGEGQVKPIGEMAFDKSTLGFSKAAGIIVLSEELVRLSQPNAETAARNELVAQCSQFLDEQFIGRANAGGPDHPASITNGVSFVPSTGTDQAALLADLNAALAVFDAAGVSTMGLAIVMPAAVARGVSMILTPQGVRAFPDMTPSGGTLMGYQVIVSDNADPNTITIFKPSEIFLADDGKVTLDSSNQATLSMTNSATATFSLWQNNAIGIRAERWIRWQPKRPGVVSGISGANYGPTVLGTGVASGLASGLGRSGESTRRAPTHPTTGA